MLYFYKMVYEIRLDDMDLSREFITKMRSRRNKFMIDDNPVVYDEPDCPKLACQLRGTKWECYQELYEECKGYEK